MFLLTLSKKERIKCLWWKLLLPESSSFRKMVSINTKMTYLRCFLKWRNKQ